MLVLLLQVGTGGMCGLLQNGDFEDSPDGSWLSDKALILVSTDACRSGQCMLVNMSGVYPLLMNDVYTPGLSGQRVIGTGWVNGVTGSTPETLKCKREITINNNGGELELFQVKVDLTSAIYDLSDLVGSWHFNENEAAQEMVAPDRSGGFHDARSPGEDQNPLIVPGVEGYAVSFDGGDDVLIVNDLEEVRDADAVTITAWFKSIDEFGFADGCAPFNLVTDSSSGPMDGFWWDIRYDSDAIGLHLQDTNGANHTNFTQILGPGQWYFIAFVISQDRLEVYINDTLAHEWDTDFDWGDIDNNTINFFIGSTKTLDDRFRGIVDEVRIYTRALGMSDVRDQYCVGATRLGTAPSWCYYHIRSLSYVHDDVRFTSDDGTTHQGFWLEDDRTAWVLAPEVPKGTSTVYLYYGSETADSMSNGMRTFQFFDDFESGLDTDLWWITEGSLEVVAGRLYLSPEAILASFFPLLPNTIWEARAGPTQSGGQGSSLIGTVDPVDWLYGGGGGDEGSVGITWEDDDNWYARWDEGEESGGSFDIGLRKYRITYMPGLEDRIVYDYNDGEATVENDGGTFPKLHPVLYADVSLYSQTDHVLVRGYASPQPTAALGSESCLGYDLPRTCGSRDVRIGIDTFNSDGAWTGSSESDWASGSGADEAVLEVTSDIPADTDLLSFAFIASDCVNPAPDLRGLSFDDACLRVREENCAQAIVQNATLATASSSYAGHPPSAATGDPLNASTTPADTSNCAPQEDMEWRPATPREHDWLDLSFKVPVHLLEVELLLDHHPGRISNITAYPIDGSDTILVWTESVDGPVPYEPMMCNTSSQERIPWSTYIREETYIALSQKLVNRVRISLSAVENEEDEAWSSIDAVTVLGCQEANCSCYLPSECTSDVQCPSHMYCQPLLEECLFSRCTACEDAVDHTCTDKSGGRCCSLTWYEDGNCCEHDECDADEECAADDRTCTALECNECELLKDHACVDKVNGTCCEDLWIKNGNCCTDDACEVTEQCLSNNTCAPLDCTECQVLGEHECVDKEKGACCDDEWFEGKDCCVDTECYTNQTCTDQTCTALECDPCFEAQNHQCLERTGGRCCGGLWLEGKNCCENADCLDPATNCTDNVCTPLDCPLCMIPSDNECIERLGSGKCCDDTWVSGASCCEAADCTHGKACSSNQCTSEACVAGKVPCDEVCYEEGSGKCCSGTWYEDGVCCSDDDCQASEVCNDLRICATSACSPCQHMSNHICVDRTGGICCSDLWIGDGECCGTPDCPAGKMCSEEHECFVPTLCSSIGDCVGFMCESGFCSVTTCANGYERCGTTCNLGVGKCCSGTWQTDAGPCIVSGTCGHLKNADFKKKGEEWAFEDDRNIFISGNSCASGSTCLQQDATGVFEDLFHQDVIIPPTLPGYQAIAGLFVNGISEFDPDKGCANDDARIRMSAYDGNKVLLDSFTGDWASVGGEGKHHVNETWNLPKGTQRIRFQMETNDCVQETPNARSMTFDDTCLQTGIPWCSKTIEQYAASAKASSYYPNFPASDATGKPLDWDSTPDADPSNCEPMAGMEWRPATDKGKDWLELTFDDAVYLDRLMLVLDHEPGRIATITAHPDGSEDEEWYLDAANVIWTYDPDNNYDLYKELSDQSDEYYCDDNTKKRPYWSPSISRTQWKTDKVRIDLEEATQEADEAWSSIDAVFIEGCKNANPHPPTNIRPQVIRETTATLDWNPGFDFDGDDLDYHIDVGTTPYGSDIVDDAKVTEETFLFTFDYVPGDPANDERLQTYLTKHLGLPWAENALIEKPGPTYLFIMDEDDEDKWVNISLVSATQARLETSNHEVERDLMVKRVGSRSDLYGFQYEIDATLTFDTTYYVRIHAKDKYGGLSPVTDTIFRCSNEAPGTPYDILPHVTEEITPTITWKSDNLDIDLVRYTLNVGSEVFRWSEVPGADELGLRRYLIDYHGVSWIQDRVLFDWDGLGTEDSNDEWDLRVYLQYWHELGDWVSLVDIDHTGDVVTLAKDENEIKLVRDDYDILMDVTIEGEMIIDDWELEVDKDGKVYDPVSFTKSSDDTMLTIKNFSSAPPITFKVFNRDVTLSIPGNPPYKLKLRGDGDDARVFDRTNIVFMGQTYERSFTIEDPLPFGDYYVELWAEDIFPEGDPDEGEVMPNGQSFLVIHTFTVGDMPYIRITSNKTGDVLDGQKALEVKGESNFPLSEVQILVLNEFGTVVQASDNCKVDADATGNFKLTKDKDCKPLYNKGDDKDHCEDSRKAWSLRASVGSEERNANHTVLVRMKGKSKLEYHPSVLECVSIDATPCSVDLQIKNLGGLTSLTIKTGPSLRHWAQLYPVPPPTLDALQEVNFNIILNPPGIQSTHVSKLEIYLRDHNDDRCGSGFLEIPVIIRRIQLLEILDYYVRLPALGRDVELVKRFAIMEVNEDEEELVSIEITVW